MFRRTRLVGPNFFEGKLKLAFVRVVKVIAVNQVAFDSFIVRAEGFNAFQIAMKVSHDIRDSAAAFFSDEGPYALPSKTKKACRLLSSVVHDCW